MKPINKIYTIIIILSLSSIVYSCNSQAKDPNKSRIEDANESIEKQKGQFNPAFQTNPQSTHIAVKVNFDNGVFQLATPSYTTRPGKLPYSTSGGSNFAVEMRNANNAVIGKYFKENPTTVRVCEEGTRPAIRAISKGSFDLLLPPDRSIAFVESISEGKSIGRLNVPMSRLVDSTRNQNLADTLRRPQ